jgi:hypothetical protein
MGLYNYGRQDNDKMTANNQLYSFYGSEISVKYTAKIRCFSYPGRGPSFKIEI